MPGEKITVSQTENVLMELNRMKMRLGERAPKSVRGDTREAYTEALQLVTGVIDAIKDAASMNMMVSVIVTMKQPFLPGMEIETEHIPFADDWYDEDGSPF